ncbi:hypothetical protein [Desemzia sp. FAM 23989]|uniref:hypothetical protein n=1 Tax=Desemzia sp. FAM 23989 TaxID=3259523 RepID=UPI003889E195
MKKTSKIEVETTSEETLQQVNNIVDSFNPENESLLVMKVSSEDSKVGVYVANHVKSSDLLALQAAFLEVIEGQVKDLVKKDPLQAFLLMQQLKKEID